MQALSTNISRLLSSRSGEEQLRFGKDIDQGLVPVPSFKTTDRIMCTIDDRLDFSDIPCSCLAEDKIAENIYHFICLEKELKSKFCKKNIGNLSKLRVIDCSGFKDFCNFYLDAIIDLWGTQTTSLKAIYLEDCFDDDRSMTMVLRKLLYSGKDLETLSLGGNDVSCHTLFELLQGSVESGKTGLKELILNDCELRDKSFLPKTLNCLSSNFTNLTTLRIDGCQLSNYSDSIAYFLSTCHSLEHLDLSWNSFGGQSSSYLISSLNSNPNFCLRSFSFKGNNLMDGGHDVFDRLATLLNNHPCLNHLDISNSSFYFSCLSQFKEAVTNSQFLSTLIISKSLWWKEAITDFLSYVIKYNKSLRTLDVSMHNGEFSKADHALIADSLRFNTTLDNFYCDIKTVKAQQLYLDVLAENRTIQDTFKSEWGSDDMESDATDYDADTEASFVVLFEESRLLNIRRSSEIAVAFKVSRLLLLFTDRLPFELSIHLFELLMGNVYQCSSNAHSRDQTMFQAVLCRFGRLSIGNLHQSPLSSFTAKNLITACSAALFT